MSRTALSLNVLWDEEGKRPVGAGNVIPGG